MYKQLKKKLNFLEKKDRKYCLIFNNKIRELKKRKPHVHDHYNMENKDLF